MAVISREANETLSDNFARAQRNGKIHPRTKFRVAKRPTGDGQTRFFCVDGRRRELTAAGQVVGLETVCG